MGKLTTEAREELPKKDFALPGKRKYPVNDKNHARNALARASQAAKRGDISDIEHKKIIAKADAKLGKQPNPKPPVEDEEK